MATISITKSYLDGEILLEADLDNIKDDVETFLNVTGINDDNIQAAGITASSKLIDATITTAKLADDCVTAAKIAATAISASPEHNGFVGEVRMFHTFAAAVSVPRGWLRLIGIVVNETNYDAQHGSGAYATDGVASSALLNKTLPDMQDRYAVGAAGTSQDGSTTISAVGNTDHLVNLAHSHTVDSHTHTLPNHVHQWYDFTGSGTTGNSYNSSGASQAIGVSGSSSGSHLAGENAAGTIIAADQYVAAAGSGITGGGSPGTDSQLSATFDVQPESVEFVYIIKVV